MTPVALALSVAAGLVLGVLTLLGLGVAGLALLDLIDDYSERQ